MADNHDDQYEEYNYDDKFYAESASRKGKSKKAAHLAAKSHSGSGSKAGQERKIVDTIANAEQKRKEVQKEKWNFAGNNL